MEAEFAVVRSGETAQDARKGRFAAARFAHDGERTAAFELDLDTTQRRDRRTVQVVAFAEPAGFKNRLGRRPGGRLRHGGLSPREGWQAFAAHTAGNVARLIGDGSKRDRTRRAQTLDDMAAAIGKGAADGQPRGLGQAATDRGERSALAVGACARYAIQQAARIG